jgi:hypothetical protein
MYSLRLIIFGSNGNMILLIVRRARSESDKGFRNGGGVGSYPGT